MRKRIPIGWGLGVLNLVPTWPVWAKAISLVLNSPLQSLPLRIRIELGDRRAFNPIERKGQSARRRSNWFFEHGLSKTSRMRRRWNWKRQNNRISCSRFTWELRWWRFWPHYFWSHCLCILCRCLSKYEVLFEELNIDPSNGLGDLYRKLEGANRSKTQSSWFEAGYGSKPDLYMVDSVRG